MDKYIGLPAAGAETNILHVRADTIEAVYEDRSDDGKFHGTCVCTLSGGEYYTSLSAAEVLKFIRNMTRG